MLTSLILLLISVAIPVNCGLNQLLYSEVLLPHGLIKGEILYYNLVPYYSFKGIPYAAPPVGPLRFKPPVDPEPWTGILKANSDSKVCCQIRTNTFPFVPPSLVETEDCLKINVYVPKTALWNSGGSLPVMVFIHGGGFFFGFGSSIFYGPDYFMEYGVILVTFNYRLGAFGFLTTEDGTISANLGLKDQLFALKWVQKNIHLFGGDPNKVTLFGESAGGASVLYHVISPQSKGLFRAAIVQSGTPLNPWAFQINPRERAFELAKKINSSVNDTSSLYETLMNVPAGKINQACQELYNEAGSYLIINGGVFAPTIEAENETAFITKHPYDYFLRGDFERVPIIMGINSEEALNEASVIGGVANNIFSISQIRSDDHTFLIPVGMNLNSSSDAANELGNEIQQYYCKDKNMKDDIACFIRYYSDNFISRGVMKTAKLLAHRSDVYFYQFSFNGKVGLSMMARSFEGLGKVAHFEEIYYLFHNSFTKLKFNFSTYRNVQITLLTIWTNFAKYLNPIYRKSKLLTIDWPVLQRCDKNLTYMNIDESLSIMKNPRNNSLPIWEEWFEEFAIKPYSSY